MMTHTVPVVVSGGCTSTRNKNKEEEKPVQVKLQKIDSSRALAITKHQNIMLKAMQHY
jgi:hypothetical protein